MQYLKMQNLHLSFVHDLSTAWQANGMLPRKYTVRMLQYRIEGSEFPVLMLLLMVFSNNPPKH